MKGGFSDNERMEQEERDNLPATLKQIGFLYVLGAEKIPKDLNRTAASEWIDELVKKQESE